MIYLRNRLAEYEIEVARYYMKRGAYVGAANRARGVIETYDGAPSTPEALKIAAEAYRKLGIQDLASVVDDVRIQNPRAGRRVAKGRQTLVEVLELALSR
jgi:outer membrane protein assembly factor BamD